MRAGRDAMQRPATSILRIRPLLAERRYPVSARMRAGAGDVRGAHVQHVGCRICCVPVRCGTRLLQQQHGQCAGRAPPPCGSPPRLAARLSGKFRQ